MSLVALGGVGMMVLSSPAKSTHTEPLKAKSEVAKVVKPEPEKLDVETLNAYVPFSFDDVYVIPAGPKGLEYTDKTKELNGKKVRMEGFMVKHYHDDPSIFLFAPVPAAHNQVEYMLADSLPTSLTHVIMNVRAGDAPVWKPQRIAVLGTLETGSRQEVDGRVSHVRLRCDHVLDSRTSAVLELRKPLALQKDRMAYKAYKDLNISRLSGANPENTPNEPRPTNPR